jgi:hypothetical protein
MTHYENSEIKGVDTYKMSKKHGAFSKTVNDAPSISEAIHQNAETPAPSFQTSLASRMMN